MRFDPIRFHSPLGVDVKRLTDGAEVYYEDQGLVSADDAAGACAAVCHLWWDRETATSADLHALDTLVPAWDDLSAAETEGEVLSSVPGGVKLAAI